MMQRMACKLNAWLPENCRVAETPVSRSLCKRTIFLTYFEKTGLFLSDTEGTFNTHYDAFQYGFQGPVGERKQVVDVIITG
jgi:hypothetical protein